MKERKEKSSKTVNKGFTLIELLVVVLIIGILAAIALPQYRRAVTKSKSAQLKTLVSSVVRSVQQYYLVNTTYPTNFDELDVDVEWEYTTNNICGVASASNKAIKQSGDFQIILNYANYSEFKGVLGVISNGPYKCTGFVYFLEGKDIPLNQLVCTEDSLSDNRGSMSERGDFCEKVMGETYFGQKYSWWQFH